MNSWNCSALRCLLIFCWMLVCFSDPLPPYNLLKCCFSDQGMRRSREYVVEHVLRSSNDDSFSMVVVTQLAVVLWLCCPLVLSRIAVSGTTLPPHTTSFTSPYHRKRIMVAVYRRAKPYKSLSDRFFNTRKIRNARLILNRTNQRVFCTSSAPMSVSSALFCTAALPNVTDIALHVIVCFP